MNQDCSDQTKIYTHPAHKATWKPSHEAQKVTKILVLLLFSCSYLTLSAAASKSSAILSRFGAFPV